MIRPTPWFERPAPQRSHEERLMTWSRPTWLERNGEIIVAVLGAAAIGFAVAMVIIGLVIA